ncbi:MAG TPA: PQQ-binding-like beta-propeller repeat protein [Coxiellaceae bacterium]|nr:PQQ-binding-like beta-propeller repeat protein [Coxiellaceae bacterium]
MKRWAVIMSALAFIQGARALSLPAPLPTTTSAVSLANPAALPAPPLTQDYVGLSLLWHRAGHWHADNDLILTLAIHHQHVYWADPSGHVYAFKLQNGESEWTRAWNEPFSTSIAATDSLLIVGAMGHLFAFNASNGQLQWKKLLSGEVLGKPIVRHHTVLVKTEDDSVYALSENKGHLLWAHPSSTPSTSLRIGSAPAVNDSLMITGRSEGSVVAFDAKEGALKWFQPIATPHGEALERVVSINATPVIHHNRVYAVAYQGPLVALDISNGHVMWQYSVSSYTGLSINQNGLFLSDDQGYLWGFNPVTGKVLWKSEKFSSQPVSAPTLYQTVLFITTAQGQLLELSQKTGQVLARLQATHSAMIAPPLLKQHQLCVVSQTGEIACYRLWR